MASDDLLLVLVNLPYYITQTIRLKYVYKGEQAAMGLKKERSAPVRDEKLIKADDFNLKSSCYICQ